MQGGMWLFIDNACTTMTIVAHNKTLLASRQQNPGGRWSSSAWVKQAMALWIGMYATFVHCFYAGVKTKLQMQKLGLQSVIGLFYFFSARGQPGCFSIREGKTSEVSTGCLTGDIILRSWEEAGFNRLLFIFSARNFLKRAWQSQENREM